MDVILNILDETSFARHFYPEQWAKDYWLRQFLTLNIVSSLGGALLYLTLGGFSYCFVFNKELLKHPLMLKNQSWLEICYTCKSIPLMGFMSSVIFLLEVRGYSKLYDSVNDSSMGWIMIVFSIVTFILFTDFLIYFIHRYLHIPYFYKMFHKPHHKWKVTTPFASHAFHPVDGFLQSLPYHIYVFIFPMHKFAYLILYILVNIWTVSIHDGDFRVPTKLKPFINGSAHHTDHHLYYNYNYGQYFTFWDKLCGTFKEPSSYVGMGPLETVRNIKSLKNS